MESILQKAKSLDLPFVFYRKPNETKVYSWFQKSRELFITSELNKSCFVMAPFVDGDKIVFYPDNCDITIHNLPISVDQSANALELHNPKVDVQQHIELVASGVEAIKKGEFEKVVLSRKEKTAIDPNKIDYYYTRFLNKYPTAFVYWFYHPNVGMWMGATPEQLLKAENKVINTVALAATIADNGQIQEEIVWGDKEKDEQKIVTKFIRQALDKYCENIQITKPYTYKAGSLFHIKTDIQADLVNSNSLSDLVNELHPTPALCGYPKRESQDFIIANEGYNREFYGGFLGEWKIGDGLDNFKTDLFVNLRCMKIDNNHAYLFLGGGINIDSIPEKEYLETVNKSKTVKSIL